MLILNANRSNVHLLLVVFSVYIALACVINISYIKRSILLNTLLVEALWVFFVDRYLRISFNSAIVREAMPILWILVYLFFNIYGEKYPNNRTYLKSFVLLSFIVFSIGLLSNSLSIYQNYGRFQVMNLIYNIQVLIPFFYIFFSEKWFKRFNAITVVLTIISFKRGAVVAMFLILFIQFIYNGNRSIKQILGFIGGAIGAVLVFYFVDSITGGFLSSRFARENFFSGSGRTEQYRIVFEDLHQRSINQIIIGKGSLYSISVFGTGIHNEWLEIISSYGIIGGIMYFAMVLVFWQIAKQKKTPVVKVAALQMFLLFGCLSMFSTAYFGYIGIQIFGFYGLINSKMFDDNKENHII